MLGEGGRWAKLRILSRMEIMEVVDEKCTLKGHTNDTKTFTKNQTAHKIVHLLLRKCVLEKLLSEDDFCPCVRCNYKCLRLMAAT